MKVWCKFFAFVFMAVTLCWLGWTIDKVGGWCKDCTGGEAGRAIHQAEVLVHDWASVTYGRTLRDDTKLRVAQMRPIQPSPPPLKSFGPLSPSPVSPDITPSLPKSLPKVKPEGPGPVPTPSEKPEGPGPVPTPS